MDRDSIRRVAVVRALQLGDLLAAVPALRSLRAGHPGAHVSLIGLPWAVELLPRYAHLVDEVIEFPGYPGIPERPSDAGTLARFLVTMHGRRLDLAIQLHGSGPASNRFTAALGARKVVAAYQPGQWRPSPHSVPYDDLAPEWARLLGVAQAAGGCPDDGRYEWPVLSGDRTALAANGSVATSAPYAVLNPGARDQQRRWPPDRFAAVADALAAEGLEVLLVGLAADTELHRAVASRARTRVHSLAGRLSLGALGALLAGARLVVTNDTGTSHLAAAVDAPALTVFVTSDPRRWAPPSRPHHAVLAPLPSEDAVVRAAQALLAMEVRRAA